jgi:phosphoribosylglycinamide formyltransferase
MHVLSEVFLNVVSSIVVINLHPAQPGAIDGMHAIERSYEAFQKGEVDRVGAMVHRVVKEVDRGEPVVVREVEIKKGH